LRVARKPESKAYKATLRIVFLGFTLLGMTGFVFQLIASSFQMAAIGPIPRDTAIIILAAIAAVALGVTLYFRRRMAL